MTVAELEQRVADIGKAVEQSVANHHALLGRQEEARFLLDSMKRAVVVVEEVCEQV